MRLPLLLAALAGCAAQGDAAMEIGGGELSFEPIEEGQDVLIIQGPQGGHHLLASVRARGVDLGDPDDASSSRNPSVTFSLTVDGTCYVLPAIATVTRWLDPAEDPAWDGELVGRLAILDIGDDSELIGQDGEFAARLEPENGPALTDARTVHLIPHPFND